MLTIGDAAVTHNLKRDNAVFVLLLYEGYNRETLLVEDGGHGTVVLSRLEHEIGQERGADGLAVDGEVHGDVAELEGHDGGVLDDDVADHVGAVGELFIGAKEDLDVGDLEAGELVEAWKVVSYGVERD